jgi:predicted Zn-dependent protease
MLMRFGMLGLIVILTACSTSPTGRSRLMMVNEASIVPMAAQSFTAMKEKETVSKNVAVNQYAQCVVQPLMMEAQTRYGLPVTGWEVVVFDSEMVNAFAMPGGKVGIYTGLMDLAETPDQLAAVMGHELAHVVAKHSAERLSNAQLTALGVTAAGVALSDNDHQRAIMAAVGIGAQVGIMLPFSRVHEMEADQMGQELMARAGFDPSQAIRLWELMGKSGGPRPPELLSTHPDPDNRAGRLQKGLSVTQPLYQQAKQFGKNPRCTVPAKPMTTAKSKK